MGESIGDARWVLNGLSSKRKVAWDVQKLQGPSRAVLEPSTFPCCGFTQPLEACRRGQRGWTPHNDVKAVFLAERRGSECSWLSRGC